MFYLLIYDVVDDYVERRTPLRQQHLELAREYAARGMLVLGGALADPVDQAVLVFEAETIEPVQAFVDRDPYVKHGLVHAHRIRPWNVAVDSRKKSLP
ncbi:MAG: YciI-like protein [Planctomycetota bacterium]|jgi:uncharacterized protein YciI